MAQARRLSAAERLNFDTRAFQVKVILAQAGDELAGPGVTRCRALVDVDLISARGHRAGGERRCAMGEPGALDSGQHQQVLLQPAATGGPGPGGLVKPAPGPVTHQREGLVLLFLGGLREADVVATGDSRQTHVALLKDGLGCAPVGQRGGSDRGG